MLRIAMGRQGGSGLELTDALCEPAFFRSNILFITKHRSLTFVQLMNYAVRDHPELDPKIIRRIVSTGGRNDSKSAIPAWDATCLLQKRSGGFYCQNMHPQLLTYLK